MVRTIFQAERAVFPRHTFQVTFVLIKMQGMFEEGLRALWSESIGFVDVNQPTNRNGPLLSARH